MTKHLPWAGGIATFVVGVMTFAMPAAASPHDDPVLYCREETKCAGNQNCHETHCYGCGSRCEEKQCELCEYDDPCSEPQCLKIEG